MTVPDTIIDRIYEAAFVPDCWGDVLERVAGMSGSAAGALLVRNGPHQPPRYKTTSVTEAALHSYVTTDAWKHSQSAQKAFETQAVRAPAAFSYLIDFMTPEETARDTVRQRINTLGLDAQIGTMVPIMTGELAVFTFERWLADGRHSAEEIGALNGLRPHLARASLMAARLGLERANNMVGVMEGLGLPAAVLSARGRVLASNALLEKRSDVFIARALGTLSLATADADALLQRALLELPGNASSVTRSIPIPGNDERAAMVVHALPLRRGAHDVFSGGDVLIVANEVSLRVPGPPPTVLIGLFDLTPGEAKIAGALLGGATLAGAAAKQQIQITTARSYLEQIFRKTGTHQQSQLVALLSTARPMQPPSS